eukprot:6203332-Pleurochrysis_carterae.AAC.1
MRVRVGRWAWRVARWRARIRGVEARCAAAASAQEDFAHEAWQQHTASQPGEKERQAASATASTHALASASTCSCSA